MNFTAEQIAEFLEGKIAGDSQISVNTISKIEEAKKGSLSFLSNPNYEKFIYSTEASIVLVNNNFKPSQKINSTIIRVEDAYQSLAKLLELYESHVNAEKTGIEQNVSIDECSEIGNNVYIGSFSYISKNAKIGKNVKIYPQTYIGENVTIEDNTIIYSGVKIYRDCKIGKNCVLHSGVVVGADGFGFAPSEGGRLKKIPQIGNVVIEDMVEIGSNSTIDRATMGSTIIRKGAKIDNLNMIAHNVEVGENTIIIAQAGISGSTKIGKNCMIGGQVGVIGHISIADEVKIAAQSGIGASIKTKGEIVQGSPAYKVRDYQRSYVMFRKLPELKSEIESLKKELQQLKTKL